MDQDRSYLLFCPPHLPLRLSEGASSAIGRHSSCEFVLRKEDISRRHCEVFFEGGQFRLRDLGSTNGTFVNGQQVEDSAVLNAGDKIEIGSSIIVFCQVDGDVGILDDEPSAAKTMVATRMPEAPGEAFQGDLSQIPTDALLQLLEMGRKTGLLELSSGDGKGRIWIDQGYPIHAETQKALGFDAALAIVLSNEGRFRFDPQAASVERTIDASVTELLLEASRLEDEASQ